MYISAQIKPTFEAWRTNNQKCTCDTAGQFPSNDSVLDYHVALMLVGLLRVFQVWHLLGSRCMPCLRRSRNLTPCQPRCCLPRLPFSLGQSRNFTPSVICAGCHSLYNVLDSVIAARRLKLDFLYLKNVQLQSPPIVYCRE